MFLGSLLPVILLQKTPEYEKYTVPSTKNFLPLFMAAPLGDKSFLPYYHRIPHTFSAVQTNNKAALMTMWEDAIYCWTKKIICICSIVVAFPSSWLLQVPPSSADKFTYFIIVTIIIAYYYYYYFHFSGSAINTKKNVGGCHLLD